MQKTVYICDQCGVVIGGKKHLSLQFSNFSGVAVPPKRNEGWGVHNKLTGKFMHFCNGRCIGAYFTELMKKVV